MASLGSQDGGRCARSALEQGILPRSGSFGFWLLTWGGSDGHWRSRFLFLSGFIQARGAEAQPSLHSAGKAIQHRNDHQRQQRRTEQTTNHDCT